MTARLVTVEKASEETGYTKKAIERKIDSGVWPEGMVWIKAPDGRRLIDMAGYDAWARGKSFQEWRHAQAA